MKTNEIFYNSIKDEFYSTNLYPHGGIPPFSIDVTVQYREYRALELQGYTRAPGEDGLPVYTAPEITINKVAIAKNLIDVTNHFDTDSFQSKYWTEEEEVDFEKWRHSLFEVIYEGSEDLIDPPDFVQAMLDKGL